MIKAYSQRLSPPYSGVVQIAESERARAITMDGANWEFHFLNAISGSQQAAAHHFRRSFKRAAYFRQGELSRISQQASPEHANIDPRILELANYLESARLPFPAADNYEYWLLDYHDETPLALIFSCTDAEQMAMFPQHTEWTALPSAVMPIEPTEAEQQRSDSPVNYRLERLVAERAGSKPRTRWFNRRPSEPDTFPPLMLCENWQDESARDLCQRYIRRQSTRLLMLHGLESSDRRRLEQAAQPHVFEVERFFPLYPDVVDEPLLNTIRVEARLRKTSEDRFPLQNRRGGVLYI